MNAVARELVGKPDKLTATPHPTNICFGAGDVRTAYVTLSRRGTVAALQWPEAGLRLNIQQLDRWSRRALCGGPLRNDSAVVALPGADAGTSECGLVGGNVDEE
ncbi:hypothetical protein ACFQX4_00135 [Roseomonas sp. GCM10028921]